jgi:hypothetical protein
MQDGDIAAPVGREFLTLRKAARTDVWNSWSANRSALNRGGVMGELVPEVSSAGH